MALLTKSIYDYERNNTYVIQEKTALFRISSLSCVHITTAGLLQVLWTHKLWLYIFSSHPNVVQCRQVHDFCQVTTLWKKEKIHITSTINIETNLIFAVLGPIGLAWQNENCFYSIFAKKRHFRYMKKHRIIPSNVVSVLSLCVHPKEIIFLNSTFFPQWYTSN